MNAKNLLSLYNPSLSWFLALKAGILKNPGNKQSPNE